jgi:hypothetical protein
VAAAKSRPNRPGMTVGTHYLHFPVRWHVPSNRELAKRAALTNTVLLTSPIIIRTRLKTAWRIANCKQLPVLGEHPPQLRNDMRRSVPLVVVSIALITIVSILVMQHRRTEPAYQGIRLTEWLARSIQGQSDADSRVRAIGTNAVPTLLKLLGAESSRKERLWFKILNTTRLQPYFRSYTSVDRRVMGVHGFSVLGTNVAFAVPRIVALAAKPSTADTATLALAKLGDAGVAHLIGLTSNVSPQVRRNALEALGLFDTWSPAIIDAVTNRVASDPTPSVRWTAARLLNRPGIDDQAMIAALAGGLKDENYFVRLTCVNSLAYFRHEKARDALRAATADPELSIREAAKSKLAEHQ